MPPPWVSTPSPPIVTSKSVLQSWADTTSSVKPLRPSLVHFSVIPLLPPFLGLPARTRAVWQGQAQNLLSALEAQLTL